MAYDPESTVARPLLALAQNNNYGHRRRGLWRRPRTVLIAGAALLVLGATTAYLQPDIGAVLPASDYWQGEWNPPPPPHGHDDTPPPPPPPAHPEGHPDPHAPLDIEDGDIPPPKSHPKSSVNVPNKQTLAAEAAIAALRASQPSSLSGARTRYTEKTGRPPPHGFDAFYAFATVEERQCLVDAYNSVYADFAPFWVMENAREERGWFRERVGVVEKRLAEGDSHGVTALRVRDGRVVRPEYQGTYFDEAWEETIGKFSAHLPSLTVLINGRDEPRVVFDVAPLLAANSSHSELEALTSMNDKTPFAFSPSSTAEFFRGRKGCGFDSTTTTTSKGDMIDSGVGIIEEDRRRQTNEESDEVPAEAISFLHSPSSAEFTTDLVPVLSMAKIVNVDSGTGVGGGIGETMTAVEERHTCFADIGMAGEFYYRDSRWAGKFEYPDDVEWEKKKDVLYWRGKSNGGHIRGKNYKQFPRFRLVDMARLPENAGLFDVAITNWHESHCTTEDCDAEGIKKEYNITGEVTPREEAYGYKYLLDIDGNSFSGRYLGLLRSGSLVFKSTAFTEFFTPWLRPWEHFVPVRPDLGDLAEKIRWARDNEGDVSVSLLSSFFFLLFGTWMCMITDERNAQVRRIQEAGRVFAEQVLSDAQNDCHWFAVMMEWGALWGEV
ncbi:hypothetical protein FB45DRAFT_930229 [Roridomyces roridus]|uniref:Glycosyl transferase CAP10 domain-containing protein n=1 Tax=Roridomyces roridus TaxID=1738132 RepID=A0AAD7BGZ6_9AGAR|nr:hypothetical protein FB45DRAFT_930229 [Roridomyces roridus]